MPTPKFPMAEKAINEITDYLGAFHQKVPPELTAIQRHIIDVIDKNIPDNSDKDALMTLGILLLAPEELILDDTYRFKKAYNATVQELVLEMLELQPGETPSADLSRVIIATTICGFGQMIKDLENNRLNPLQKNGLKQAIERGNPIETELAEAMRAPDLHKAYFDMKAAVAKALGLEGPKAPPKFPKKPGGNLYF
jgi:hypothetical protein